MNGLLLFFATAVAYVAAVLLVRWVCAELSTPPSIRVSEKLMSR
jgi:hypothetical protein